MITAIPLLMETMIIEGRLRLYVIESSFLGYRDIISIDMASCGMIDEDADIESLVNEIPRRGSSEPKRV